MSVLYSKRRRKPKKSWEKERECSHLEETLAIVLQGKKNTVCQHSLRFRITLENGIAFPVQRKMKCQWTSTIEKFLWKWLKLIPLLKGLDFWNQFYWLVFTERNYLMKEHRENRNLYHSIVTLSSVPPFVMPSQQLRVIVDVTFVNWSPFHLPTCAN